MEAGKGSLDVWIELNFAYWSGIQKISLQDVFKKLILLQGKKLTTCFHSWLLLVVTDVSKPVNKMLY